MKLVFLDTETTGTQEEVEHNFVISAIEPMYREIGSQINKIVQIAYIAGEMTPSGIKNEIVQDELCNPKIPMCVKAVAVTGITPEMVVNKPSFQELNSSKILNELNREENVIIIHNAPFDLEMLSRDGFNNKMQVIDTLRVIRHLFQDDESHSMQWYRYARKLYLKEPEAIEEIGKEISAHDALGDVIVLKLLFEDLLSRGITIPQMIDLTKSLIMFSKMPYGKYRGELISSIFKNDAGYMFYLYGEEMKKDIASRNNDLVYTISQYLTDEMFNNVKFTFGKYKGFNVSDIIAQDAGYAEWLIHNIKEGGEIKMPYQIFMAIEYFLSKSN